jgi:hypothetical protein
VNLQDLEAIGVKKKGLRLRLEKAAQHLPPLNIKVDVPVSIVCVCVCVTGGREGGRAEGGGGGEGGGGAEGGGRAEGQKGETTPHLLPLLHFKQYFCHYFNSSVQPSYICVGPVTPV